MVEAVLWLRWCQYLDADVYCTIFWLWKWNIFLQVSIHQVSLLVLVFGILAFATCAPHFCASNHFCSIFLLFGWNEKKISNQTHNENGISLEVRALSERDKQNFKLISVTFVFNLTIFCVLCSVYILFSFRVAFNAKGDSGQRIVYRRFSLYYYYYCVVSFRSRSLMCHKFISPLAWFSMKIPWLITATDLWYGFFFTSVHRDTQKKSQHNNVCRR